MRAGFIGLGNQGGPIAERILAAGHALTVWARRPEMTAPFRAAGATAAASPEALAPAVEMLCICVLDDAGVREICSRALPQMAPGSLLIVLSTVHPQTCVKLGAQAATHGKQRAKLRP